MDIILGELKDKATQAPGNEQLLRLISSLEALRTQNSDRADLSHATPGVVDWDLLQLDLDALAQSGVWEDSAEREKLAEQLRLYVLSSASPTADATNPSSVQQAESRGAPPRSSDPPSSVAGRALRTDGDISELTQASAGDGHRDISIVLPPPDNAQASGQGSAYTSVLFANSGLPDELVEAVNDVYFLHLLATDPTSVLPPGKSLLSVLSSAHAMASGRGSPLPTLQERVEDIVHRAFWDEAIDALANPIPGIQLARIRGLYTDLHEALQRLLPRTHPALHTLALPPSPTNAPLHSAQLHLRETLSALRERCAPVRDAEIDSLLARLDDGAPAGQTRQELATVVAETVRGTLELAERMHGDLAQFVLGTLDESELRGAAVADARARERAFVLRLWPLARVRELWAQWLGTDGSAPAQAEGRKWPVRLVQALGATVPVACPAPAETGADAPATDVGAGRNTLPPPLFFCAPALLHLQNILQALVICAALRALTRLPTSSSAASPSAAAAASPSASAGADFMHRIWTLLRAEVDAPDSSAGHTRLEHLADEVVRAARAARPRPSPVPASTSGSAADPDKAAVDEEEQRLRAAVDRTLRTDDPAFALLQRRLLGVLSTALSRGPATRAGDVPEHMRTGRDAARAGKRPRLDLGSGLGGGGGDVGGVEGAGAERERVVVKGFEDPVLSVAVEQVLMRIRAVVAWTEGVWPDVVNGA